MYKKIKTYIKNYFLEKNLVKQSITEKNVFDVKLHSKNVLIIDDKLPEFDKDSGSRRLNTIIDIFLKNKIGVFLLADFKEYKYKTNYLQYYKKKGVIVYQPYIDQNKNLVTKEIFIEKNLKNINLVWLHRPLIFKKYFSIIKKYDKSVKIVFDMVDFHYMRIQREASLKSSEKLKKEAQKFLEIEIKNCKNSDKIIVISETDKQNLLSYYPNESKMVVVSNIHNFIENNIHFKPFEQRKSLLFVGGFDHLPNIDAVNYLHQTIMPLVWKTHSEIKIIIIGSNPTQELLNLNNDRFQVLGYVEDLTEYFNNSKLFVAPLQYGAGIKGKIGQSMEYGLPLVTTTIGAEGFDFGEYFDFMVTDNADNFAKKIIEIYNNESLWNLLSKNSQAVLKPFSESLTEQNIISLIN